MNPLKQALKSYSWFLENSIAATKLLSVTLLATIAYAWAQTSEIGFLPIVYLVWLIVISMVMIQLHRFILLDLELNEIKYYKKPKKSTFIYLGYWVLITALERASGMLIEYIPLDNLLSLLSFIIFLPLFLYILIRFYMVLPATAIDRSFNFAWALSKGNEKHLILSTLILLLLMVILLFMVVIILAFSPNNFLYMLAINFSVILNLFIVNVHYSLLFKLFIKEQNKTDVEIEI
tara:strand:- start:1068 stop:1769 length:702 start_codon:yes stop_codon:yes gene_type:complete